MKLFFSLVFLFPILLFAQQINNPNVGSQSHPTLKIKKIEFSDNSITIDITAENQSQKGDSFCADKNIYISDSNSEEKQNVKQTEGVPQCPELHYFKQKGEKLKFTLRFQSFKKLPKYIDLVENCDNYCFNFKGVVLDVEMNTLIDKAYNAYQHGNDNEALALFEETVTKFPDYPYALLHFNIIKIYNEIGNSPKAEYWTNALETSKLKDKDYYLDIIGKY